MMKISRKNIRFWFPLLIIVVMVGSYSANFRNSENDLYKNINEKFQDEESSWSVVVAKIKKIPNWGNYNLQNYLRKKKTTLLSGEDTIEISTSFYHPKEYSEYQRLNFETILLFEDDYDIWIVDSLFKAMLTRLNLVAESSVELKVRDLHQMFPTIDSMCTDVPFVKTFSSGSVEGYTTEPIGVGICNHALLYGHVKIPFPTVLSNMALFDISQIFAIVILVLLYFSVCRFATYYPIFFKYRKNVVFIGNTCIDLYQKELYLWSGEYRHITDTRMALLQMLVESAPAYKLSKEEVCLKIWNRNAKDGQALYNVVMTDMRTLFITEDPSLELKSLPREGMQLLVNESLVKRGRWLHFMWIYMAVNSKRVEVEE